MLWKRILSAIIGIILLIFFIYWGTLPFALLVIFISILLIKEYNRMLPVDYGNNQILLAIFSIITILYTYLSNKEIINIPGGLFFFLLLLLLFIYHIISTDSQYFLERLAYNLLGIIYIGGGLAFFILLRNFNIPPFDHTKAIWLVFLTTWAADTGAYFIGMKFGKTKFIDKSPNKSIEGVIGGIFFAIIFVSLYTKYLGLFSFRWIVYTVLAVIIAIFGDLFESSLKRAAGIKDSGNIIPGHGGVLDRLDSLFFSAPFTYFFLLYFL